MIIVAGVTYLILARAIWIRRWTLRATTDRAAFTERTITMSLLLQLASLILWSPLGSATLGRALHAATGYWHLDAWGGHCCYLGAAGLLGVALASRLNITNQQLITVFKTGFEYPFTLIIGALLMLLMASPNANQPGADLLDARTDYYLDIYWSLLCGYLILMYTAAVAVLAVLRRNPLNRATANLYILACAGIITDCGWRIITTWTDINQEGWLNWASGSAGAIAFAYAAERSWRTKIRRLVGGAPTRL